MTDPTPDPTPELSPEATERLRLLLAAPAAPAGVVDGARAAAMAAFDEVHGATDGPAAVRDIRSGAASRSSAWYQRIPIGAAAAVIAVVALVGVATQVDFGSTDADTAASSGDADQTFDDSGAALEADEEALTDSAGGGVGSNRGALESAPAAAADGSTGGTSSGGGAASGGSVSAYEDVDSLVDDFAARYGGTQEPTAPPVPSTTDDASPDGEGADDSANCDAVQASGVDPAAVVAVERTLLGPDSVPTSVVVYDSGSGRRVSVIDDASCAVIAERAL